MCGRFVRKRSSKDLATAFRARQISDGLQPSFNIAPTHNVAVVVDDGERRLVSMRWGLVPSFASDLSIGSRLINARAETLINKSAFKHAFRHRRCLVLADGFYEWLKQGAAKTPMLFHLSPERSFGFAGLYETWKPASGEALSTCTIITTEANDLVRPVHDRMPVILPTDVEDFWLDSGVEDPRRLLDLLQPYPANEMAVYEVSTLVNSVKNDSPACIEKASGTKPQSSQSTLFD
jgi:putative SOS response-associated peptidase YedK